MNESGLEPAGWRLIVLPEVKEKTTEGGIVLPQDVVEREDMAQVRARVVAVGELCWKEQKIPYRWCNVGDDVIIAKYAGLIHKVGEKTYRIINDTDVVAVFKG